MDNVLEYRGYSGSVEFSAEDRCFFGKLLFINDVIMYDGVSVDEVEKAFKSQVDAYLAHCEERGVEPNKPCRGLFNVRISPALHQQLSLLAVSKRTSLNDVVKDALECYVRKPDTVEHRHIHSFETQPTMGQISEFPSNHPTLKASVEPNEAFPGGAKWLSPRLQ
ncbi:hypothetical protein GCM10007860_06350 [Chitiniphilus shinanonensis]|uniref:HicB family protein n=1 Tax=Chitiniphilus shinanonensis TaxID=553088 RepID=A0ABQ6BSH6_9NEIS|nr:type II toxin-antitoxin system HicB family antitoxin [Chitiniphilus shinanonensis]GLS03491.1 hypothetical protein GCM10007860_06350 [Chitiniphilus shinanonensis]